MIEHLIQKYLEAETTREEERELQQLLLLREHLTSQEKAILQMVSFAENVDADVDDNDETDLYDQMMAEQEKGGVISRFAAINWRRVVPVAAILSALVLGSSYIIRSLHSDDMAVAYIYGNEVKDSKVAISMMRNTLSEVLENPDNVEDQLTDILNP